MPHDRFFAAKPLLQDDSFTLEGEEYNHLIRVMRVREQEEIECLNGKGRLATVHVDTINKKNVDLRVVKSLFFEKPAFSVILAQAIPRHNHLDLIVEKGCELGMTDLWLFKGERSEKGELSETQQTRVQHLLVAALKQCGSYWLPEVKILPALKSWQQLDYPAYYGALEEGVSSLKNEWAKSKPERGLIFFTGPEKGLSDSETETLKKLGAIGVTLHPNILRTETASLAALSIISHLLLP